MTHPSPDLSNPYNLQFKFVVNAQKKVYISLSLCTWNIKRNLVFPFFSSSLFKFIKINQ